MSTLRAALLIAGVDLRRRLRNRSLVTQAVAGPLVLATIVSLAFGGATGGIEASVGIVDADGSPASTAFVGALTEASEGDLEFEAVDSAAEARRQVDDGDLGAAVVVPEGFTASLAGDDPGAVDVVVTGDRRVSAEVARSLAATFTARVNAARLAGAVTTAGGGDQPSPGELAAVELPVTIDQSTAGDELSPAAFFGPSMGLLFLFLTVGLLARSLLEEKRLRLLDRVRAAPVRDTAVLAGKCLAAVVVGVVSLATIWLVTALALDADWGDPLGVALLVVATALAVAGIAGVVAAVARTDRSADTFATVVAFVLALVGGNFIPPGNLPEGLRQASLATPNGWALQGFAELSVGGGTVADVLPHAAVLLAWALVTGVAAAILLPRRLAA
jgi:ABC-2 type transport system permease protein